jgi:hypothetical protein
MPEPSPLFWEHFSARVRDQVAHETPDRAGWWTSMGVRALVPLVAALVMLVAVFSVTLLPRIGRSPAVRPELASTYAAVDSNLSADADAAAPVDAKNAEVWDVLTAAASDMGVEDAHAAGMATHPGAVDHEVTHLSQAELTELGRLLQTQLKGSGH